MSDPDLQLEVTFSPPLYIQRRLAILQVIRKESCQSILDIGCGEGGLLAALSQPAPWLPEKSPDSEDVAPIYPKLVMGLDIADLEFANQSVQPAFSDDLRWTPLKVKLWQGSLEQYNPEFFDMDCIVATEVIEHLQADILSQLPSMILGVYRPRIFIVTTPNYTFNARFTAPDSNARDGYPDPTGRTDRVFRHDDHKFEWTRQEFDEWCTTQASTYGYDVQTHAIGRPDQKDPWGRDPQLGGASQVAEFTRRARISTITDIPTDGMVHRLFSQFNITPHPSSGQPGSLIEIGEAIQLRMEEYREALIRLEELWFDRNICVACGGSIDHMVSAVKAHPKLELVSKGLARRSLWQVQLVDGITTAVNQMTPVQDDEGAVTDIPFQVPLDWGMSDNMAWSEGEETDESNHGWGP